MGDNLSHKQEKAIAALLSEATVTSAAEKPGVSEVTLYRWLKLPDFVAAYREARREVVEKAMRSRLAKLEHATRTAARGISQILVTVPRSSYLDSGTECHEHSDCRFTTYGPVETHFLRMDLPGSLR